MDDHIQIIVNSENICVLTGAGISAESGIPTFRGAGGMWAKYRPEELATPEAFAANPRLVWEWYQARREAVSEAAPNPGHKALAEWEGLARSFVLVTQNVDGLHRAAGSRQVLELHGNIRRNRCTACGRESTMDEITFNGQLPLCECGGLLRPAVVWFGESLPEDILEAAFTAVRHCDLFLAVGTSAVVYPAAALPRLALDRGVPVIEVNTEETPLTAGATYSLRGPAGEVLPPLVAAYASAPHRSRQIS
jgi:NAD-dependent deacetylase